VLNAAAAAAADDDDDDDIVSVTMKAFVEDIQVCLTSCYTLWLCHALCNSVGEL